MQPKPILEGYSRQRAHRATEGSSFSDARLEGLGLSNQVGGWEGTGGRGERCERRRRQWLKLPLPLLRDQPGPTRSRQRRNATQRNATHGNGAVEETGGRRGEGRSGWAGLGWRQEWRVAGVQQPRRRKIQAKQTRTACAHGKDLGSPLSCAAPPLAAGLRGQMGSQAGIRACVTQHAWAPGTAQPDSPPRRYLEKQAAYLHPRGSGLLSGQETSARGTAGWMRCALDGSRLGEIGSRAARPGQARPGEAPCSQEVPDIPCSGRDDGADSGTDVGK
ncbi:hypothetical protein GGTG_07981 [Gaeumannomyces tritici R3-111a-1]|uniref:Uncharacterized protein n=1 Tax=Gaeumannomyces tritici (strain R3-111a-1) TaxID=644352 RepID=J3P393_GAET3|nr:hypothetical protein GGTG_07981 [Gaeumannomyces tritici R3-111a-1]EJT74135.1 hypothetical protein GGTG_07981 [Gaeumannomyces tritici R3-111a-1]